nr:MAG TPA: hypothetical protein [Caudoviricetes sp.]
MEIPSLHLLLFYYTPLSIMYLQAPPGQVKQKENHN